MKKLINKIIISLWVLVVWVSLIPSTTLAAKNNCNWFWAKCNTEDIHTYHTDDKTVNSRLLDTIKNAINWFLWILATVVLCFLIYGWFKMLSSAWDSKWYDAWRAILKNALIWLAIILLAWLIVSIVFWFVAAMSGWNQTASANVSN
jgi:hypothetical protein